MIPSTTLFIYLELDEDQTIDDVVGGLPDYCSSTFHNTTDNLWKGEFRVTCPIAPELAEGDLVEDLAPYFPTLLSIKNLNYSLFEFRIVVGAPGPDCFELKSDMVAMLAVLESTITTETSQSVSGDRIEAD